MWTSGMERLDVQKDILESQRSVSPSTASESGEEQGSEIQTASEPFESVQRMSRTLSPASISVSSEENKVTTTRSQLKIKHHCIVRTDNQSFTASFPLSGESTLQGTPWEEALYGKRPGKKIQRTDKETEIVAFWRQFFG